MPDTCGGKNYRRPRRKTNDELQILKDEMPALVRIELTSQGNLAWDARAIAQVSVDVRHCGWAEIEAAGGIGATTWEIHLELGLILANHVHVGPEFMIDLRIVRGQQLGNVALNKRLMVKELKGTHRSERP